MNFLLDTHAFLWWIGDDARLPLSMRERLGEAGHTIHLSVVSLWEIVLKFKLGKLRLPEPMDSFLMEQIERNRFELLPVEAAHVFETLKLPVHHRDPFDRLLIAQARAETLTLLSADAQLRAYPVEIDW
jgi:PIN domain nuclease of toxin-antitoxin system